MAFIVSKRPDVVSFNEIMRYSSSSQPQMIADKLRAQTGETWTYKWVQKSGASSGEGECVMTRLDVDATDDFLLSVARSVAMIRVNVNGRIVHVFSTHLDHQSSATRVSQVKQLVSWADNHSEQRIIAGDLNGWPGTAEINEMRKPTTMAGRWRRARASRCPSRESGRQHAKHAHRLRRLFEGRNRSLSSPARKCSTRVTPRESSRPITIRSS